MDSLGLTPAKLKTFSPLKRARIAEARKYLVSGLVRLARFAPLALLFFWASPSHAQQTQVAGCIVDPNSIPYAGGQILITIAPAGGPAPTVNGKGIQGTFGPTPLDSGGCFQQALWPNAQISPGGTQWNFAVTNPGAAPPVGFGPVQVPASGGGVNITISGATQNVGSTLSAVAPKLFNDSSGGGGGGCVLAGAAAGNIVYTTNGTTACAGIPNSIGNTPTNGFTLSDGAGQTTTYTPTEVIMSAPDNPGVIQFNSEGPTVIVGNQATVGSSTLFVQLSPGGLTAQNTGTGATANINQGSVSETDASGNNGTLAGAGLTLNGPAGISIVCDGTVPSCTWDAGLGSETVIGAGSVIDVINTAGGVASQFASTDTVGAGANAVIASVSEIDNAGVTQESDALNGSAGLSGTNVTGDTAFGGNFTASDNSTGGTAAEISGLRTGAVGNGTTALVTGLHITHVAGGALTAAELIDKQGASIPYQQWANTTSGATTMFPPATGTEVITFPSASGTLALTSQIPELSNQPAHSVLSNNTNASALPAFNTNLFIAASGTHPTNGTLVATDTETTGGGANGGIGQGSYTDSAGAAQASIGWEGSALLAGSNVAGDTIQGGFFQAQNTGTGAAAAVEGIEAQFSCTAATVLCFGIDINSVGGTAGVTTAGLNIKNQGTNFAIRTGTGPVSLGDAVTATAYKTAVNCSSSASPAVCTSATAGSVALPTNAVSSSIVVNTTAVTANSQIFAFADDTLGTKLGITCNSTVATLVGGLTISARTAGTSFTISNNVAVVTNPLCVSYVIIN